MLVALFAGCDAQGSAGLGGFLPGASRQESNDSASGQDTLSPGDSLQQADSLQAAAAADSGGAETSAPALPAPISQEDLREALALSNVRAFFMGVVDYASTRWLPTLAVLLAAWLAGWIGKTVGRRFSKRWIDRTDTLLDDYFVDFLGRVLRISHVLITLLALVAIWSDSALVLRWLFAVWIGLIFLPLSGFVGRCLEVFESKIAAVSGNALDRTALPMINRGIRFVVLALGIIVALSHAGVNIGPLIGAAGVAGVAISLAAKDTLSNLIAGVLLIIDRPFQVGDRIELWAAPTETGSWGDVIEIGLRATKIRNPDNLVVVVPNNEIMRRDIVNYTMSGQEIRLRIPFSVAYESDIAVAKKVLVEIALATEGVKDDPLPFVIVRKFGASDIQLQLRVWIKEARRRRAIADSITNQALPKLKEQGVEIPYPRQEIVVKSAAEAVSRLGSGSNPDASGSARRAEEPAQP